MEIPRGRGGSEGLYHVVVLGHINWFSFRGGCCLEGIGSKEGSIYIV